jgi:hypothetical protein
MSRVVPRPDQVLTAPDGRFRVTTTVRAVLPVRVAVIRGRVAAAYATEAGETVGVPTAGPPLPMSDFTGAVSCYDS